MLVSSLTLKKLVAIRATGIPYGRIVDNMVATVYPDLKVD